MENKEEIWKDVVGFEGFYRVSSKGRIATLKKEKSVAGGAIMKHEQRILPILVVGNKKQCITLAGADGRKTTKSVTRIVAEAFLPCNEDNKKLDAINIDGDYLNNDLENIKWGTRSEAKLTRAGFLTDKIAKNISVYLAKEEDGKEVIRLSVKARRITGESSVYIATAAVKHKDGKTSNMIFVSDKNGEIQLLKTS